MRWLAAILLVTAGAASAEVPLAIAESGHATVPVSGSFGTRQFVFDTGAQGSAVYPEFADEARFESGGDAKLQGQTGTSAVELLRMPPLSLDGHRREGITAVRLAPRADGVKLAGIVGLDLFGDRTVDFDLPHRRLALHPPGTRLKGLKTKPVAARATAGDLLTVPVFIGAVEATAVIDTGARKTRINWALGRLLGLSQDRLKQGDTIQGATNNAVRTSETRLPKVLLGQQKLINAPALVADLPVFQAFGVADRPAIILGMDWLEKTRMVIDFPARTIWFESVI